MSTADLQSIKADIIAQTAFFNELRLKNANAETIGEAKKKLGDLKRREAALTKASGDQLQGAKKRDRLLLKTAKGTRDYSPGEMFCREYIEAIVRNSFKLYGGSCLDTPVFERRDVLAGKYGEDAKLIFDLADQGGEELSLRYDHTVPLARYLAMSIASTSGSKLYQFGKVYRRDNPVMSKGRMREFSQADFDISGVWDPMIPDAEIISLLSDLLTKLEVGEFTIKINHRKILDGVFEICGVPPNKIRAISSAVDKMDKSPWSEVRREMIEEKGLAPAVADQIGLYVKRKGGADLLEQLEKDETMTDNACAKQGIADMALLFRLLKAYRVLDKISFDLSLARGLDYYTGIIYEAVVAASAPPGFKVDAEILLAEDAIPKRKSKKAKAEGVELEEEDLDESQVGVGSIAAGGRYDDLVGMFTAAAAADGKKTTGVPCVGVSIGLDRIFAILWPKWVDKGMREKDTLVYVMAAGDGLLEERIELTRELRDAGIKTEFLAKSKPKIAAQFAAGERDEVPFAIILGEAELSAGLVTVKEQQWEFVDGVKTKIASTGQGFKIKRDELVSWLKSTATWKQWQGKNYIS